MTQPDTLTTALAYAARGWRVFPLLPGSKRPATPNHRAADCDGTAPGCHTAHAGWEQRATLRADKITRAWSSNPTHGVGIACGPSRLVVVDLDTHKPGTEIPEPWKSFEITTGADVLDHLAGVHGGTITPTYTVRTISGGTHLYYAAPAEVAYGNTAGKIGWLIDTRAHGGYVAAPPTSIGPSAYEITDDRPAAPLPMFLVDLLTHDRRPAHPGTSQDRSQDGSRTPAWPIRPIGSGELRDPAAYVNRVFDIAINGDAENQVAGLLDADEGGRNAALYVSAATVGKLVARGLVAEYAALDRLMEAAAGHIAAGAYTAREAENTILSGFRRASTRRTAA